MKAALYARVSTIEQVEGYSIDAQKRAFKLLRQGRQWDPVAEYIDEGKSARTDKLSKRPAFRQSLADAQSHVYDVLVVHKLDRFSRNQKVLYESLDILVNAGVGFASVTEQLDFTTPAGRAQLGMLGVFAQWYSDNLSQETKKGKNERKAQGFYNGILPFGVMKGPDGLPKPHDEARHIKDKSGNIKEERPPTYPGLLLAFQLEQPRGRLIKASPRCLTQKDTAAPGPMGQTLSQKTL